MAPVREKSTFAKTAWLERFTSDFVHLGLDAVDLLADLDNFIAIGCLCHEDYDRFGEGEAGTWSDIEANQLMPTSSAAQDVLGGSALHDLAAAGWIRIQCTRSRLDPLFLVKRVYVLADDVGLGLINRRTKKLQAMLQVLVSRLDITSQAWDGKWCPEDRHAPSNAIGADAKKFDAFTTSQAGSLYWMFNQLPSPNPSPSKIDPADNYARETLEDLLDGSVLGLHTDLYPYQRRSAALMVQRESSSSVQLDPRLEPRTSPDGNTFYYAARDFLFLKKPRYFDCCKGGIVAESMGMGKTVICLAMVLATKNHPPKIPPHALPTVRSSVGTLSEMAASSIHRKSVPWKVDLERARTATGEGTILDGCRRYLEQQSAEYFVPVEPQRWNRNTIHPPPRKMLFASTTLIIVPRNLCRQWQSEIKKHVEADALHVLVLEDPQKPLPTSEELRKYDVILFSQNRFAREERHGSDTQGRRLGSTGLDCHCPYIGATRTRDCTCLRPEDLYHSPLKNIHFKRIIIDEGHFFSNTDTVPVRVAHDLVTADHHWVVSGTPAKGLLGIEVGSSNPHDRRIALAQRMEFSKADTTGAINSLGALASGFLGMQPWKGSDSRTVWEEYIYRHEDFRRRTYSGFSTCLRQVLTSMVIKTRPEDVERDMELPTMHHEIVRLEPSFYDKITANLFTLMLTANAVTSERVDVDYLFHKNSAKFRYQLVSNLRKSAFFWTGFNEEDVFACLKSCDSYLAKETAQCSDADRALLTNVLQSARQTLDSEGEGWRNLTSTHEIGIFVRDWPADSAEHWSFDHQQPLLTGVSQLLHAQKYVNERSDEIDPGMGLAGAGIKAISAAKQTTSVNDKKGAAKAGIPTSGMEDGPDRSKRRASITGKAGVAKSPSKQLLDGSQQPQIGSTAVSANTSHKRKRMSVAPESESKYTKSELPPDSPYLRSRIVGTTSTKLSYLLSQLSLHQESEKILVFYEGDNIAYYLAQALDLLHIRHAIYAKSLKAHLKSETIVRFDQEDDATRVLLMDVNQAAYGLNVTAASRIYFVNPVCRPDVEAQAIKRAHRIGQRRRVHVETLVLAGSMEEAMLDRARNMTTSEHRNASHLEDDAGIRHIIESATLLPIAPGENQGDRRMAPLQAPIQLWGSNGWRHFAALIPSTRAPGAASVDTAVAGAAVRSREAEPQLRGGRGSVGGEGEEAAPPVKRARFASPSPAPAPSASSSSSPLGRRAKIASSA